MPGVIVVVLQAGNNGVFVEVRLEKSRMLRLTMTKPGYPSSQISERNIYYPAISKATFTAKESR
jgi:hypothetical protein